MDDLISRQAAIKAMMHLQQEDEEAYGVSIPEGFDGERAAEALSKLPPAEQERKTGRCSWCDGIEEKGLRIEFYWIDDQGYTASFSSPHVIASGIAKHCPECGRKLRMEVEHETD